MATETIKVISTVEQIFKIDWDAHEVSLESSKVVDSIMSNSKNTILNPIRYQFEPTEAKYGIISLGKKHPYSSIYKPGAAISVNIGGMIAEGKFHSKQIRIDGLTKIFNEIEDLEARVFEVEYSAQENTLIFKEI